MSGPYTTGVDRRVIWFGVALALALMVAIAFLYLPAPGGGSGPAALAGKPASSFQSEDLSGHPMSLATFRGHVVVLNLWASWCPPCRAEMPDLQRLSRAYASRGLVVLGVDQGEARERAAAFATSLGITYPILVDQSQQYGRVYAALGMPTTIIVDRNGIVATGFDGALTFTQMRDAVVPVLGQ